MAGRTALWLVVLGCNAPTETIVRLDAEADVRARARSLTVVVIDHEGEAVEGARLGRPLVLGSDIDLPAELPLHPRGDDAARGFFVRAYVRDAAGCAFAGIELGGGYTDGESTTIDARLAAPEGLDPCAGLFVDADASGLACTLDDPCPAIADARDRILSGHRPAVIHVEGDKTYAPVVFTEAAELDGLVLAPRAFSGRPTIRAMSSPAVAIERGPTGVSASMTIRGFALVGGVPAGVLLNRNNDASETREIALVDLDITASAGPMESAGILWGTQNYAIRVERCTIHDNIGAGLLLTGSSGGGTLVDNAVHRNTEGGIRIEHAGPHLVARNRVCENGGLGVWVSSPGTVVEHNTVVRTMGRAVVVDYSADSGDPVVIRDNLIAFGDEPLVTTRTPRTVAFVSNLVFDTTGPTFDPPLDLDPSNIELDPLFADDACDSLTLGLSSPALGTASDGTDIGACQARDARCRRAQ